MVKNEASEVDLDTWNCIFQSKLEELQRPERWILGLHEDAEPGQGWRQYTLHAFACFRCSTCDRQWESAMVRIIFHIRQAFFCGEENLVNMRVFKQACQMCETGELEEPEFLIENIAVAMDWLVTRILMKCYDEDVSDRPVPAFITNERKGGVHDTRHCEACRLGLCHLKPQGEKDGPPSAGKGGHLNKSRESQKQNQEVSKGGIHDPEHCLACLLGLGICHLEPQIQKTSVQPALGEGSHFYDTLHSQEKEIPNAWETRQRNREANMGGVQSTVGEGSHFYGTFSSHDTDTANVWEKRQRNREASMGGVQPALGEGSHFYDPLSSQEAHTDNAWKSRQKKLKKIKRPSALVNTNRDTAASGSTEMNRSRIAMELKCCCPCVLL